MLNKKRLLTPGPTPLPEEVRLALAQDTIHHRKSRFKEIMQRVQGHLRELFRHHAARPAPVLLRQRRHDRRRLQPVRPR